MIAKKSSFGKKTPLNLSKNVNKSMNDEDSKIMEERKKHTSISKNTSYSFWEKTNSFKSSGLKK